MRLIPTKHGLDELQRFGFDMDVRIADAMPRHIQITEMLEEYIGREMTVIEEHIIIGLLDESSRLTDKFVEIANELGPEKPGRLTIDIDTRVPGGKFQFHDAFDCLLKGAELALTDVTRALFLVTLAQYMSETETVSVPGSLVVTPNPGMFRVRRIEAATMTKRDIIDLCFATPFAASRQGRFSTYTTTAARQCLIFLHAMLDLYLLPGQLQDLVVHKSLIDFIISDVGDVGNYTEFHDPHPNPVCAAQLPPPRTNGWYATINGRKLADLLVMVSRMELMQTLGREYWTNINDLLYALDAAKYNTTLENMHMWDGFIGGVAQRDTVMAKKPDALFVERPPLVTVYRSMYPVTTLAILSAATKLYSFVRDITTPGRLPTEFDFDRMREIIRLFQISMYYSDSLLCRVAPLVLDWVLLHVNSVNPQTPLALHNKPDALVGPRRLHIRLTLQQIIESSPLERTVDTNMAMPKRQKVPPQRMSMWPANVDASGCVPLCRMFIDAIARNDLMGFVRNFQEKLEHHSMRTQLNYLAASVRGAQEQGGTPKRPNTLA